MARNKYPEETVQKILEVAQRLFLEKGYEKTTIQDIVDGMGGLTKGAIYHHFKSKEEIIDAIGDQLFRRNNPFEQFRDRTDLNALEKLERILEMTLEPVAEQKEFNFAVASAMKNPRFLCMQMEDNSKVIAPQVCELLEEGNRDGSIQTTQAKMLSEVFMLLMNVWFLPELYPTSSEEEFMEKIYFAKNLFESLGIPVFTERVMKKVESYKQYYFEYVKLVTL